LSAGSTTLFAFGFRRSGRFDGVVRVSGRVSGRASGRVGGLEIADDLVDLGFGLADLASTQIQQAGGTFELAGEFVDIGLLGLDSSQNRLEFRDRLAKCQLEIVLVVIGDWATTRLLITPSASCVRSRLPGAACDGARNTLPSSPRVIENPRRSVRSGES